MTDGVVFRSVPDLARRFGVSKDYLYTLIHSGQIQFIACGKKYLIHVQSLAEFLETESKKGLQS